MDGEGLHISFVHTSLNEPNREVNKQQDGGLPLWWTVAHLHELK